MFSYISSTKFGYSLALSRLSDEKDDRCLGEIAKWVEDKWGYLRNYPGIEKRKELIKELAKDLYLVKYAGQLIGMFRLVKCESLDEKANAVELTHVYIDERLRHAGIGGRMVDMAKRIASLEGATLIFLDTLTPVLNRFYQKHGATGDCEARFFGAPSSKLMISLKDAVEKLKKVAEDSGNKCHSGSIEMRSFNKKCGVTPSLNEPRANSSLAYRR